ncbi:MAG: methionyl-tRNA formyltransferase [Bacteroidales bacterium]|nr:methionyl-tRNA formyltransferase [Candidatus Physcousia equi]
MRIIYMGTPEFAVEPLRTLLDNGEEVVAVVTNPDKPIGRHQDTLQASPVKQFALERGIPVLQPERLKDENFLAELRSYEADLQVVVAFRMLPEAVWDMPRMGTFNLHTALLPDYRGAAPMNWAIINGETETGVTTFFLDHDIDTGRIIMQERTPIAPDDNVGDIHDRLMTIGAALVLKTVRAIADGTAQSIPQDQFLRDAEGEPVNPATLHHAPKIFKETCRIDWTKTAQEVHNFVRGLSPYPGAWTTLVMPDGKRTDLKVYRTHLEKEAAGLPSPSDSAALALEEGTFRVLTRQGVLVIDELQLAGKRRMAAADFLRGARFCEGAHIE